MVVPKLHHRVFDGVPAWDALVVEDHGFLVHGKEVPLLQGDAVLVGGLERNETDGDVVPPARFVLVVPVPCLHIEARGLASFGGDRPRADRQSVGGEDRHAADGARARIIVGGVGQHWDVVDEEGDGVVSREPRLEDSIVRAVPVILDGGERLRVGVRADDLHVDAGAVPPRAELVPEIIARHDAQAGLGLGLDAGDDVLELLAGQALEGGVLRVDLARGHLL
mmetsp:Transcript_17589/g.56805  ORF Transcript_17589/g.56805 Transcript_17589/m.56805 type:complete len:223 (-) Transcript_17589:6449-7117(-)